MKKPSSFLVTICLLTITFIACMNKEKPTNTENLQKVEVPETNLNNETYDPGPDYKLTWADEFKGDAIDDANWNFQVEPAGRFNKEWQRYTNSSDNAYIEDECMVIKAVHVSDDHGMDQYTSARMNTANKQSWKYGKIVARIKLPYGKGIWPAFWMLGANIDENGGDTPWPQCGEIDILELYGSKDDGVVECNIHYANASDKHESIGAEAFKLEEGKFADAFHIFELHWDEERIAWSVDGIEYSSTSIAGDEFTEFHEEFFILLNIAVGGEYAGRPDASSPFPQYMYIDWIRVYQKAM